MMAACVVLALVVGQVLKSWVPLDIMRILCYLITHPKITHFHALCALALDGVIGDADGRCIIAMDRGFGLWVPEFLKGESKNHSFLAIKEEGT
jgi:hypothetical protein